MSSQKSNSVLSPLFSLLEHRSEAVFAVLIAISTVLYAAASMYYARYAAIIATQTTEKSNSYLWYQSKGLRESMGESQISLMEIFLKSGAFDTKAQSLINEHLEGTKKEVSRYAREKKEILLGSQAIGKDNWAQELNGELGKIVGAKEMEEVINKYSVGFSAYEWACLLLQIALGIGTVGLVLSSVKLKAVVALVMMSICAICTYLCVYGYVPS